jgi:Cu/Zn superoxide dismutase
VDECTPLVNGLSPGRHGINIHEVGGDLACDDGRVVQIDSFKTWVESANGSSA